MSQAVRTTSIGAALIGMPRNGLLPKPGTWESVANSESTEVQSQHNIQ